MTSISGQAFIDGEFRGAEIRIADGRIAAIVENKSDSDDLIVPGFIDVHVHGGAGADFMDGNVEAARAVCRHHAKHGTTSLAATTLSASRDDVLRAIGAAREATTSDGAEIVAVHFEGPYINASFAGAQDRASIRPAAADELGEWLEACGDLPAHMTIAPETDGALELIRAFAGRMSFSVGHSGATYHQAREAFAAGARHVTHLFNAMSPLHHREPGIIGAATAANHVSAEVIADGMHLHPATLHIAATLFQGCLVLVTDAMRACGMPDGTYKLYEHDVLVRDGAARLKDGALAGSVLTTDAAVRFMHRTVGLPLETVIPFATTHPARLLGCHERKGRIVVGGDADLVILNRKLEVQAVMLRGEMKTS